MRLKPYVRRLFAASIGLFVVNKFVVRPWAEGVDLPRWAEVLTYSSPNAIEGVVGMTVVCVMLLTVRRRLDGGAIGEATLFAIGAALTSAYVLTQEFGLHHLGGRNVVDPLDAVASVVGVLTMWLLFSRFGVADEDPGR
ncbi:MAG: hypothetical protein AAF389_10190 [Gemmatimonadota bacterium]